MSQVTPLLTTIYFSCMLGVLALLAYAVRELYRLWKRNIYHRPISSSLQTARLTGYLLLAAILLVVIIVYVWVFWIVAQDWFR
jgi:hypothetical protein